MKPSINIKHACIAALLITISGCNHQSPEAIYGIRLGRPAIEEFRKASKDGKIEYSEGGGAWMNLANDVRGNISYSVFSDGSSNDLLESVSINFFSKRIYTPPAMGVNSPYIFRVTKEDESFIRNLFFKKYGIINKSDSVKSISDANINKNCYSLYKGESWIVYTYAWLEDDREITLNLRSELGENSSSATASYYFRRNYINSLKSEIKSEKDNESNNF